MKCHPLICKYTQVFLTKIQKILTEVFHENKIAFAASDELFLHCYIYTHLISLHLHFVSKTVIKLYSGFPFSNPVHHSAKQTYRPSVYIFLITIMHIHGRQLSNETPDKRRISKPHFEHRRIGKRHVMRWKAYLR